MGEAHRKFESIGNLMNKLGPQPGGQPVQVNIKILGPDFTVMALFDSGIHFLGGTEEVLRNLGKPEAAKAFKSALDHLISCKHDLFQKAVAEAEKLAPKVEVATPSEIASVKL